MLYENASNPVADVVLFGVYAPFISAVFSRLYTLAHAAEPAPLSVGKTFFVLSLLASLEARALYRANRAAEAFDAYCYFADLTLLRVAEAENKEKSHDSVPGGVSEAPTPEETLEQERKILFEAAKRRVLFFNGENQRSPLEPFADYAEFLRFIETEFAKTDDPLEYKNAVQFWRDAENVPLTEALDKPRRVKDDYTFLSDVSLVL